jgi:hypothetical protein
MAIENPHNLPTIHCEGCNEEVVVGRRWAKSRKFCIACQVVRDLDRFLPKGKACARCGGTFFPIRHGKGWDKCPDCVATFTIPQLTAAPRCNVCERKRPPAYLLDHTCLHCVTSTEALRNQYYLHLKEIVANRVEKFIESLESAE